jgi:eukaryotic-like serine/threonine-protein kinase
MTPATLQVPETDLDRRVAAFEAAWSANRPTSLAAFLPVATSDDFAETLAELIRIDLEFRAARGESPRLNQYRTHSPELFQNRSWLQNLAFEEYRQRLAYGERPQPAEYVAEYGVNVSSWPHPTDASEASVTFPSIGDCLGAFRLLRELGRGSFGRVYLAEQLDLAGRKVALKVTTRFSISEPETLAKLQHTHIVPIYSAQKLNGLQAIVMPYLGGTTLADILVNIRHDATGPRSGSVLADTIINHGHSTKLDQESTTNLTLPTQHIPLEKLRALSFPDAVLWLGEKLAQALAHAHDRGILHRDIKPANILLTDDGQPMLLDFNLAHDTNLDRAQGMGGTPAYMAPEQLLALKNRSGIVDARADLYSLGLVLAELLLGRSPFDTDKQLVSFRAINPTVTPSCEAILRKCLAVKPDERYACAHELAEEFRRQLEHQPLRLTHEPSVLERFTKWRRRHPVLTSTGSVTLLATIGIVALASALYAGQAHLTRLTEERSAFVEYQAFHLAVPKALDAVVFSRTDANLDSLLAKYDVAQKPEWWLQTSVTRLPEPERRELRQQVAELQLLKARQGKTWDSFLPWSQAAEASFRALGEVPQTVWRDRYDFALRFGQKDRAQEYHELAKRTAPLSRDFFLSGLAAHEEGNFTLAKHSFHSAITHDPTNYWSWLLLGDANSRLGNDDLAEGCFHACIALKPQLYMAYFNRGLGYARRKLLPQAIADFTQVLELDSSLDKARINRGLAYLDAHQPREAAADFTHCLDSGCRETRLYLLRAEARIALGDVAGSQEDHARGMQLTPCDEISALSRGLERAKAKDTKGALEDFDLALKFDPKSYAARMNKANVLDEQLHREAEAILELNAAIREHPHQLAPRAGRAVLHARRGDRTQAHEDALWCRTHEPTRETIYQLAGVYAVTSKTHPADRDIALDLLREALQQNFGLDVIPIDTDLDPIRELPAFRELVQAARRLAPSK